MLRILTSALTLILLLSASVIAEQTVTIWTWPLSGTTQQLAEVSIESITLTTTVKSYTPPSPPYGGDSSIRVGFYDPATSSWRGILTSSATFDSVNQPKLVLHVDSAGEVYHLGFEAAPKLIQEASSKSDTLSVEVLKTKAGPTPHLNKPVVLSPEGKLPEKEAEKTFLQKYWWAIGLVLLFQVVAGGGGK